VQSFCGQSDGTRLQVRTKIEVCTDLRHPEKLPRCSSARLMHKSQHLLCMFWTLRACSSNSGSLSFECCPMHPVQQELSWASCTPPG